MGDDTDGFKDGVSLGELVVGEFEGSDVVGDAVGTAVAQARGPMHSTIAVLLFSGM